MRLRISLVQILLLVVSGQALANPPALDLSGDQPLDWQELDECIGDAWCSPNERSPVHQLPFVAEAGSGIQVAVGTERGFMSLAINENLNGLVLADYEIGNVFYNRVNIALLQVARDREHYLHLRLDATFEEWQKALRDSGNIKIDPTYFNEESFRHWQSSVRRDNYFAPFHRRYFRNQPIPPTNQFKEANYLFDDKLYNRLALLAKSGRIQSLQLDLTDERSVNQLVAAIRDSGERIAILDVSNAFDGGFGIEPNQAQAIAARFLPASDERSIILITRNIPEDGEEIIDEIWEYDSRTIQSFASMPEAEAKVFLQDLRGDDPKFINHRSDDFCLRGFQRIK